MRENQVRFGEKDAKIIRLKKIQQKSAKCNQNEDRTVN